MILSCLTYETDYKISPDIVKEVQVEVSGRWEGESHMTWGQGDQRAQPQHQGGHTHHLHSGLGTSTVLSAGQWSPARGSSLLVEDQPATGAWADFNGWVGWSQWSLQYGHSRTVDIVIPILQIQYTQPASIGCWRYGILMFWIYCILPFLDYLHKQVHLTLGWSSVVFAWCLLIEKFQKL